jgi:hypothetical protein
MAGCMLYSKRPWSVSSSWRPRVRTRDHMARRSPKRLLLACILLCVALTSPHRASAWGDEGHKVIALIAEHYVDPAVRAKVATLLAADTDALTNHDIASEATWADKYRDSDRDTTKIRYSATWPVAL